MQEHRCKEIASEIKVNGKKAIMIDNASCSNNNNKNSRYYLMRSMWFYILAIEILVICLLHWQMTFFKNHPVDGY